MVTTSPARERILAAPATRLPAVLLKWPPMDGPKDSWVGRIVETLKEKGIYEDTIIVYTSDHGDLLGDHGLVYKQCFYE